MKVKSEIYFSPKKILHRKQISDWMRKAQDQANNEVYLKAVSQLFSGEIPVVNYIPKYTSDHKKEHKAIFQKFLDDATKLIPADLSGVDLQRVKISIFNPDAEALKAKKAAEAKVAQKESNTRYSTKNRSKTEWRSATYRTRRCKKPASAPPIPAMSIKDPNFSSKLSGSLLLRSDATFTPTLPSEHGEMTKKSEQHIKRQMMKSQTK